MKNIINTIINNIQSLGYTESDFQKFVDEYGWQDWMSDYIINEEDRNDPFYILSEKEIDAINEVLREAWEAAFRSKLHILRKNAGLTQKQLADTANVHINIISRIERGERPAENLHLGTAARLAKALNCNAEDLLD